MRLQNYIGHSITFQHMLFQGRKQRFMSDNILTGDGWLVGDCLHNYYARKVTDNRMLYIMP